MVSLPGVAGIGRAGLGVETERQRGIGFGSLNRVVCWAVCFGVVLMHAFASVAAGLLVVCLDGSRTMQANHRASKADSLCILFGSSPFMFANRSRTLGKLTPLRVSLRVSFRSFRVHCNAQGVVLGVTEKSLFRRPVVGSECPLRVIQRSSPTCLSILTGGGDDRVSRAISQPRIACEKWCEDADRGGSWT